MLQSEVWLLIRVRCGVMLVMMVRQCMDQQSDDVVVDSSKTSGIA